MLFGRLMTAMATPFDTSGELDVEGVQRLTRHLIDSGTETLVVNGTTGESPTLSSAESKMLIQLTKETAGVHAKVLAGVGTNSTASTIERATAAMAAGADGVMVVTPYYNRPPQASLYKHFVSVAEAVDAPMLLYNVPSRTGCNLLPATVVRLAEHERLFGIKEASGNLDQVSEIVRGVRKGFAVYSGDDSLTLPMIAVGAVGVVSVASHLIGPMIKEMMTSLLAGNLLRAQELHALAFPLIKALFATTSPIPLKWALNHLGLPGGPVRPPLYELSDEEAHMLRAELSALGKTPMIR